MLVASLYARRMHRHTDLDRGNQLAHLPVTAWLTTYPYDSILWIIIPG